MGGSRLHGVVGPAGVTFLSILSFTFVFPLYPYLQEHYGFTTWMVSVAAALSALPQVVLAPVLGVVSDRRGRRAVLLPCLGIWVLGAALQVFGLAAGQAVYPFFLTGRALQALADAGFFQTALSLVVDTVQGEDNVRWALAAVESSASLGAIVGPILAATVLPLGVRAPAAATGLVGVLLLAYMSLVAPRARPGEAMPLVDQIRLASPLLRRPQVLGTYIAGFLTLFTLQGVQTYLGFYLRDRYGLGTTLQGVLLGLIPWSMLLGAQLTPWLQRRYSWRTLVHISMSLAIVQFVVLALPLGWLPLTAGLFVGALGLGAILPLGNTALAGEGDGRTRGTLMAFFGSTRQLGSLAAPLLLGPLLSAGYGVTYLTGGAVTAASALLSDRLLRAAAQSEGGRQSQAAG